MRRCSTSASRRGRQTAPGIAVSGCCSVTGYRRVERVRDLHAQHSRDPAQQDNRRISPRRTPVAPGSARIHPQRATGRCAPSPRSLHACRTRRPQVRKRTPGSDSSSPIGPSVPRSAASADRSGAGLRRGELVHGVRYIPYHALDTSSKLQNSLPISRRAARQLPPVQYIALQRRRYRPILHPGTGPGRSCVSVRGRPHAWLEFGGPQRQSANC